MKRTFCDNCNKEIQSNKIADIFGFDCCFDNVLCEAELTLRASIENYSKPYSALIPTDQQIALAKTNKALWTKQ